MAKARHWWEGYRRFIRNNRAVSALEYAILVGVIAVGIGTALTAFSTQIKTALQNVSNQIAGLPGLGTGTGTGSGSSGGSGSGSGSSSGSGSGSGTGGTTT